MLLSSSNAKVQVPAAGPLQPRTLTTVDIRYVPLFEAAKVRLALSERKPLGRDPVRGFVAVVVTTGPLRGRNQANDGPCWPRTRASCNSTTSTSKNDLQSDADGRLTLPALIPGATYRIQDLTPALGGGDPVIRKEFAVKPGETLDLGDVVIARPQARN